MMSKGKPMNISELFKEISRKTWRDLRKAKQTNVDIGEESITDYRLMELKSKQPQNMIVTKFRKKVESQTGADWQWLFIAGKKCFGVRMQAKKISLNTFDRYDHLDYKGTGSQYQVEKLIDSARNSQFSNYPLYCFYNYWDRVNFTPPYKCKSFPNRAVRWGCSIADAHLIQRKVLAKEKTLDKIHEICRPLECLFDCECFDSETKYDGISLPELVQRSLATYINKFNNKNDEPISVPPISLKLPASYASIKKYSSSGTTIPHEMLSNLTDADYLTIIEEYSEGGVDD